MCRRIFEISLEKEILLCCHNYLKPNIVSLPHTTNYTFKWKSQKIGIIS